MNRLLATTSMACLLGLGAASSALAEDVNPQPQPAPSGSVVPPPSDDVRTPAPGDALPNTGTDSRPGGIGGAIDMPNTEKPIRKPDNPTAVPPSRGDPSAPVPPIK